MTARRRCAIATDSTCDWRVVHLPSFSFQRIRKDKKLNSLANQELRWLGLGWSGNFWIGPSLLKFGPATSSRDKEAIEGVKFEPMVWQYQTQIGVAVIASRPIMARRLIRGRQAQGVRARGRWARGTVQDITSELKEVPVRGAIFLRRAILIEAIALNWISYSQGRFFSILFLWFIIWCIHYD